MKPNAKTRAVLFNRAKASVYCPPGFLLFQIFQSDLVDFIYFSCSSSSLRIDFICQLNSGFSSPALVADCLFLPGHRARLPDREPAETIPTIFTLSRLGWPRFCIWKFRVWKESCNKYPKKITGCVIQWWVSGKENICAGSWNHIPDIWLRAVSY